MAQNKFIFKPLQSINQMDAHLLCIDLELMVLYRTLTRMSKSMVVSLISLSIMESIQSINYI